jgi:dolichyl-phosphate beta-glucosyltransferase
MTAPCKLSVIIPAYNETNRLVRTLPTIFAWLDAQGPSELVLVNDGSTDSTLQVMQEAARQRTYVKVVSYAPNRGKGRAVAEGVAVSLGQQVLVTDVDLSVPLEEATRLRERLQGNVKVAIASRVATGARVHQPLIRWLGGRGLNLFIQAFFLPGLKDTQCGFKLFDGATARTLFAQLHIDGFAFDVEVLWRVRRAGLGIAEVGVEWTHDEDSRVSPLRHTWQILTDLARLRCGLR